jgi:hypothetical protein
MDVSGVDMEESRGETGETWIPALVEVLVAVCPSDIGDVLRFSIELKIR